MIFLRRPSVLAAAALLLAAVVAGAGVKDPVEGDAFLAMIGAQDVDAQAWLEMTVGEGGGYHVTGPVDAFFEGPKDARVLFHAMRVICPDISSLDAAVDAIKKSDETEKVWVYKKKPRGKRVDGFRGALARVSLDGQRRFVLVMTIQQVRWLMWVRDARDGGADLDADPFNDYARGVSDYLHSVELGAPFDAPHAAESGLTEAVDLFAPRPAYVIDGYQNYKDALHAHEEVRTDFARRIVAFVPTSELLAEMASSPPEKAWPNKEQPLIQYEYKKFFDRGGSTRVIRTLTADVLETLVPGEYFYAVGLTGKVRFGYEIPREEVDRVEQETGKKMARANHAFLFPGEPVLTAGAFFVEAAGDGRRITHVNAHSGHYFYSNITATIRDDIAVRSDEYLMTLGHFFSALNRLGIPYDRILVSKM